jgi:hypothetical protein
MNRWKTTVDFASWKSRESNRSCPLSFEDGLSDERLLEFEDWEETGSSSSSSEHGAFRFREGVIGLDGGGVGSVCSGITLYRPSLDRKSCEH